MSAGRLQEKLERRKSVFLDGGLEAVKNTAKELHRLGVSQFSVAQRLLTEHSDFFKAVEPMRRAEIALDIVEQEWQ